MVEFTLNSVILFILIHLVFGLVCKFILKRIDMILYMALLAFFVIYLYGISLNDLEMITAAVASRIGSSLP